MTLHVDCSLSGSWFARGNEHGFNGTCTSQVRVTCYGSGCVT